LDDADFRLIAEAIDSGRCLAFLGAGASADYQLADGTEVPGLPTGCQLGRLLAKSCGYTNGSSTDLLRVAEYFLYVKSGNRDLLLQEVRKHLQIPCEPRPIHHVLAHLRQIRVALTSNYDTLLERAVEAVRPVNRHVYDPKSSTTGHFDGPVLPEQFESSGLVLHKMHGSIDEPHTLVITESDYIRYLAHLTDTDRGMPEYFRKTMLPRHNLLFLGYSLNDWNFRVIWEGVLTDGAGRRTGPQSYAVVKSATAFEKTYWAQRNVAIFEEDLTQFAERLAAHYKLAIPDLGAAP